MSVFNNYLLIGFVEADTLQDGSIVFEEKDTLFYTVTASGNDSVFYDKNEWVSSLSLPVNPSAGSTTFTLEMIDSITYDTLSFDPVVIDTTFYLHPIPQIISINYERSERIISEECGVEIAYTNVKIDETTFPATTMVENRLSRFNEVNIEILF